MHTGLPGPRFGQLLLIARTHNAWTDHDGRVRACARSGREEGEAFLGICAIDGKESTGPATGQKAQEILLHEASCTSPFSRKDNQ